MMSTVKCFTLNSGEEIIASVVIEDEKSYVLKQPCAIVIQPNGTGGMGVSLAPIMPYCSGNISVNFTSICFEGVPNVDMANAYNQMFGSGIVVAPASLLQD